MSIELFSLICLAISTRGEMQMMCFNLSSYLINGKKGECPRMKSISRKTKPNWLIWWAIMIKWKSFPHIHTRTLSLSFYSSIRSGKLTYAKKILCAPLWHFATWTTEFPFSHHNRRVFLSIHEKKSTWLDCPSGSDSNSNTSCARILLLLLERKLVGNEFTY